VSRGGGRNRGKQRRRSRALQRVTRGFLYL